MRFFSNLVGEKGPRIAPTRLELRQGVKGSSVCFQTILSSLLVSFQPLLYLKECPWQPFLSVMLNRTSSLKETLMILFLYKCKYSLQTPATFKAWIFQSISLESLNPWTLESWGSLQLFWRWSNNDNQCWSLAFAVAINLWRQNQYLTTPDTKS